jgi:hypothetical protein
MGRFREFGLHIWRRGIVRGYTTWQQNNVQLQSNLPTTVQMVQGRMAMIFGHVSMAYEWTAIGQRAYKVQ